MHIRLVAIAMLAGYAAAASGEETTRPTGLLLSAHTGALVLVATFSNDGTSVIGRDVISAGLAQGITFGLTPYWAIDFELAAISSWLRNRNGPDTVRTEFVGASGPFYVIGQLFVGLFVTVRAGEAIPFNVGLAPAISRVFKISNKVNWYIELALPVFFNGTFSTICNGPTRPASS